MKELDIYRGSKHTLTLLHIFRGSGPTPTPSPWSTPSPAPYRSSECCREVDITLRQPASQYSRIEFFVLPAPVFDLLQSVQLSLRQARSIDRTRRVPHHVHGGSNAVVVVAQVVRRRPGRRQTDHIGGTFAAPAADGVGGFLKQSHRRRGRRSCRRPGFNGGGYLSVSTTAATKWTNLIDIEWRNWQGRNMSNRERGNWTKTRLSLTNRATHLHNMQWCAWLARYNTPMLPHTCYYYYWTSIISVVK